MYFHERSKSRYQIPNPPVEMLGYILFVLLLLFVFCLKILYGMAIAIFTCVSISWAYEPVSGTTTKSVLEKDRFAIT